MALLRESSGQAPFYFQPTLMTIKALSSEDAGNGIQEEINTLFRQLNPKMAPLHVKTLLEAENPSIVLCCRENEMLLGMACMATYKVFSGYKGWIEDVVVRESHRRKGIGRALLRQLLTLGQAKGLSEILLFTGSTRQAAITLYENQGFIQKNSRLYTYTFS
jgi:phosphinothricin acetyltransferase